MAPITQPRVSRARPTELVAQALSGEIRIPRFQRPFRWDAQDAVRLFDSILRGYPIGNLLMWRRPAPPEEVVFGELRIDAPARSAALLVVDGQQRLTTLVGALTATEGTVDRRFRVFYDLETHSFLSASQSRPVQEDWLPVSVAVDNRRLIPWQRDRPWLTDDQFNECDTVGTAIRDYEIPVYVVEGDDEGALGEIFDRMNTFGKRLTRAEVFEALHSVPDAGEPSGLEDLRSRLTGLGFGTLTTQTVMQSVMAVRGGQVDRDFRNEFTDHTDRHTAFAEAEKALSLTIEFLREQAGIPHVRLLPYAMFVPVLARFCALFGLPQGRPAELLRRWIWRGSIVGVAPQGNTVGLRRNAKAVQEDALESATRLLNLLPPGGDQWQPDLTQTRLNRAQTKVNLLGMLSAHPVMLVTGRIDGEEIQPRGRIDQPSFLPRLLDTGSPLLTEVVSAAGGAGSLADTLANRALHPPLPGRISLGDILAVAPPEILRSHCMDQECATLLYDEDVSAFLERRAAILSETIATHVQRQALWSFDDGPGTASWFEDDSPPADASDPPFS
ncbi:DUF262 domain-containing protein [Streptomyces sp. NPDC092296]|uniref:DUF262 domain-containing protein n=1 Tax=Streptomyces sp. NPDC092296 TaxID=3366012 RepID=UPI0037FC6C25